MHQTVQDYNHAQQPNRRAICERLAGEIYKAFPETENKIWHGAPVWFLNGNPIVGYSILKDSVQLLFWSGQSFDEPGLKPEGTLKQPKHGLRMPTKLPRSLTTLAKKIENYPMGLQKYSKT